MTLGAEPVQGVPGQSGVVGGSPWNWLGQNGAREFLARVVNARCECLQKVLSFSRFCLFVGITSRDLSLAGVGEEPFLSV